MSLYAFRGKIFEDKGRDAGIVTPLIHKYVFFTAVKSSDIIAEFDNEGIFHIGAVHRFCLPGVEEFCLFHRILLLLLTV